MTIDDDYDDRDYWNTQAAVGIEAARLAVWSEPDWAEGGAACIAAVVDGLGPVLASEEGSRSIGDVVDVGCGIGRLLVPLAVLFPGTDFLGLDLSAEMLVHARELIHLHGLENASLMNGDVREVAFMDGLAGFYSVVTFQHLAAEMQHRYIATLAKSLRHGGIGRFQWVTDADPGPRSNPVEEPVMVEWCTSAGLEVTAIDRHLVRPGWAWITAVKP